MNPSSRNVVFFFIFLATLGAAFVLPRFAVSDSDGLAGGAIVMMTFLAILLVAVVLAIVLLVLTVRQRGALSAGAKVAGFLPLPLLFVGAIVVVMMFRQQQADRRQNELPPKTLTPTAPVTAP